MSLVRVRFAPSPTGYLHVGGARTALYCYLFAKHHQGQFILRVEDTDEERSTEESLRMQLDDMQWLGLSWDEGIHPQSLENIGEFGPYRQSHRKSIYQDHADRLLAEGKAYYCFLTDEQIDKQRAELKDKGLPLHVNSPYKDLPLDEAKAKLAAGEKAVIRFKVPSVKTEYVLKDLVRGEVTFPSDMVGDFVILRSSGMPVYNFCCAVDDALMKVSHVLRAEEHLNNTLRQIMIYQAFGYELPQFGHMSIILGEDKQKLSKRHGATSVHEYSQRGYLPEALKNFIALLGWSSPEGQEIMSQEQMIEQFSAERLHSSPAVFDEVKLKWVNATHLRALAAEDLWARTKPYLDEAGLVLPEDPTWQARALSLFKNYMETLVDAVELFRPLSQGAFSVNEEGKETMSWETSPLVVRKWKDLLEAETSDYLSEEKFLEIQDNVKKECGVKGKNLFMPIRVAVIGKPHGAELKILVPLLERNALIERAGQCL